MAKTEAMTTLYGQDRRYAAAQLDTFEGFIVIGKRRGEDRTLMTNLSAEEAKKLLAGVSVDTTSLHAATTDRNPATDPRLHNEDGFISAKEHGAAKDAARDAEANPAPNPTDAAAKDAPERVAALNAGYKTDGARIDNPTNEFDAVYSEEIRKGADGDAAIDTAKAAAAKEAKAKKAAEAKAAKAQTAEPKDAVKSK